MYITPVPFCPRACLAEGSRINSRRGRSRGLNLGRHDFHLLAARELVHPDPVGEWPV